MKKYVILAGVNGVGKSTFFSTEEALSHFEKVNLDDEVRKIGSWKNKIDVIEAGKTVVRRIKALFNDGVSFSQETTLCGNSIFKYIDKALKRGYGLEMYYVGVNSVEIAKERVRHRVERGGHGVSDEDIERRYDESIRNMWKVLPLCDKAFIYDNTQVFKRIAIYKNGTCVWKSEEIPEWYCSCARNE